MLKIIYGLLISITGPFAGAWIAFHLNKSNNKKEIEQRNKSFLIKSRYAIEKISLANKEITDLICKDTNKKMSEITKSDWENIRIYPTNGFKSLPEIPVQNLMFLLDDPKGKEFLDSIMLVNAEKNGLVFVLEERNKRYETYWEEKDASSSMGCIPQGKPSNPAKKRKTYEEFNDVSRELIKTNIELSEDCEKALIKINKHLL